MVRIMRFRFNEVRYDEKADKLYQNIAACVKPKPAESMNDGFSPKKRGATAKAKVGSYTPRDLCRVRYFTHLYPHKISGCSSGLFRDGGSHLEGKSWAG